VILAHRIALDLTVEQRIAMARAAGVARFTWNWALARWEEQYKAGEKPNAGKLKKEFNALKREEFPWMLESPKDANQQPFANLDKAYRRFFKKTAKRPKFKRKGQHDSFYVSNDKFTVDGLDLRLPVIGHVRLTEELRFGGKITAATVSREADRWFISIQVDTSVERKRTANGEAGIDLGLKTAVVTSDGQTFEAPKPLKAGLKKLRRLARAHSRKKKGSNNQKKSTTRLARHHARIKRIRQDWLHKVTTKLVRENQTLCLEDLNVKGMMGNRKLSRAISDVGFYEFRRQLEYKARLYSSQVVVINRWLPTSKACSNCACVKNVLALSERVYACEHCGFELDRDLNAARNILAAGLAVTACGQEGSDVLATERETSLDEAGTRPRANSRLLTN
jgi:putative transposase